MIELIPAIDIIDGKCVRLSQGDYATKKIYNDDPLEVARMFADHGIARLHLVDLDGAKAQHIVNHKVLERIATRTSLVVDFGGGLKSDTDVEIAFDCGASMITGGSIAVKDAPTFERWIARYGNEHIILGADARDEKIAVSGWTESSSMELIPFVKEYMQKGIHKVITTDIDKDGMLQGASVALYKRMTKALPGIYLIASGGVRTIDDIIELDQAGIPAVIFGKAIYEGTLSLKELAKLL